MECKRGLVAAAGSVTFDIIPWRDPGGWEEGRDWEQQGACCRLLGKTKRSAVFAYFSYREYIHSGSPPPGLHPPLIGIFETQVTEMVLSQLQVWHYIASKVTGRERARAYTPMFFSILWVLMLFVCFIKEAGASSKSLGKERVTLKHSVASHWGSLPWCSLCSINHPCDKRGRSNPQ